ncbi:MAG: T9SS type A sorting domain-containing protein [Bernardetiaceae bacterium]|nr:T9SS type A sorting domain-containing protein [Bernardetiaceae bacterium]
MMISFEKVSAQTVAIGATTYPNINDAVAASNPGDVIEIDGTFTESITLDAPHHLTLRGSGTATTSIAPATVGPATTVINIQTGGTSATERLVIENLTVTAASIAGLHFNVAGGGGFITVFNVTMDDCNFGVMFNDQVYEDLRFENSNIINCFIGIRIDTSVDGLLLQNLNVANNNRTGMLISGSPTASIGPGNITNVNINNCTFTDNGADGSIESGDLWLRRFNGTGSLSNVTITNNLNTAYVGFKMRGWDSGIPSLTSGDYQPYPDFTITNLVVDGTYNQVASSDRPGAAVYLAGFSEFPTTPIFTNCQFRNGSTNDSQRRTALHVGPIYNTTTGNHTTVNLGNSIIEMKNDASYLAPFFSTAVPPGQTVNSFIVNQSILGNINAQNCQFEVAGVPYDLTNQNDLFEIEDRIFHAIDVDASITGFGGFVSVVADNAYFTENSYLPVYTPAPHSDPYPNINRAIKVADNGWTIHIKAATEVYNALPTALTPAPSDVIEPVIVDKNLTFDGNGTAFNQTLINGLTMNGTGVNLDLNIPFTLSNTLTMTEGIINSSSDNFIALAHSPAPVTGGSANSYVNGPLGILQIDNLTAALTYNLPLGKVGTYTEFRPTLARTDFAAATTTAANLYLFEAFINPPTAIPAFNFTDGISIVSDKKFWEASQIAIPTQTTNIFIQDVGFDVAATEGLDNAESLVVAKSQAGNWISLGIATAATAFPAAITSAEAFTTLGTFIAATVSNAPDAPINLVATATGFNSIEVTWEDQADNEDGFRLQRSEDCVNYTDLATLPADTESYTDNSVDDGKRYCYRVRAFNDEGNSAFSNVDDAITPIKPPINLSLAFLSNNQVDISWDDESVSEEEYQVERSADGGATFTLIATLGANSESYSDVSEIIECGTYLYRVRAANTVAGTSAYSNTLEVSTLPNPPTNLSTELGREQIDLRWEDNSECETCYVIERSESVEGPYEVLSTVEPNATRFSDIQAEYDRMYFYRVRVCDFNTPESYTNVAFALLALPNFRLTLQGEPGDKTAFLVWETPADLLPFVAYYEIYGFSEPFFSTKVGETASNHFAVENLLNGIEYDFIIRPILNNPAGRDPYIPGAFSNYVSIRPSIVLSTETITEADFTLYPNPNSGSFRVEMPNGLSEASIEVISTAGQRLHSQTLSAMDLGSAIEVQMPRVPSGLYILKVQSGAQIWHKKFVVR